MESDSDETSENWLENVIGELQLDSAMEVCVLGTAWYLLFVVVLLVFCVCYFMFE